MRRYWIHINRNAFMPSVTPVAVMAFAMEERIICQMVRCNSPFWTESTIVTAINDTVVIYNCMYYKL